MIYLQAHEPQAHSQAGGSRRGGRDSRLAATEPAAAQAAPVPTWQDILTQSIDNPNELMGVLELDPGESPWGWHANPQFPLKVPRPFAARMEKGNWRDPLLRQVWPMAREGCQDPRLLDDPLEEAGSNPRPGLLRKYRSRALLTVAPHCAVHCRYCFRREFDYRGNTPGRRQWQTALDYVRGDENLTEIIFSGGDPLAAPDRLLAYLAGELAAIPQVTTLRIHTRLPVMIPARVTPALLAALRHPGLRVVVVIHANHPAEIDAEVTDALAKFAEDRIILLNQSVLLREINDRADILARLATRLFDSGVLPYYLHLPDKVSGTGHFQVGATEGRRIVRDLRARLPGYLVPRLVREVPGELAKRVVA